MAFACDPAPRSAAGAATATRLSPVAVLWGWPGFFACFLPLQLVGGFFLAAVFAVSHNVPEILYNPPRAAAAPTKTHSLPREKGDDKTPAAAPPMDWAEMQIRASANWSVGSNFWLLASGGLNYQVRRQSGGGWAGGRCAGGPDLSSVRHMCAPALPSLWQIEHHLFPGIAHVHYPAISKIIREEVRDGDGRGRLWLTLARCAHARPCPPPPPRQCALRDIPYLSFPTFRAIFTAHVRHLYALGQA